MSKRTQLLGGYLSSGAAGTATGTAAGYDAHSTVGLERSTGWLAPSTAAVRLILNLGAAAAPSGLGLAGGNFSGWGTTSLEHSSDGVTWTPFLTLTGFPADALDYFAALTAAPSRQYWSLYWAAPSAAPGLAVFYLGTLTELAVNEDLGPEGRDVYNVAEEPAASGAIIAEEYGRRTERFLLKFSGITAAQFLVLRSFVRAEGGKRPFFYIPRFDSGTGASGQAYLVRAGLEMPWTEEITGIFLTSLAMREEA